MNDYLAGRLRGLAYMSDDEWAQGTLREAAAEIEWLRDDIRWWESQYRRQRDFRVIDEELAEQRAREVDGLRALITGFLDAFHACGMTIMGDFPESEFAALRAAVGR